VIRFVAPRRAWRNPRYETRLLPAKKLVVVSPHLDDAVLSLGATLSEASRIGIEVTNLTVFAGDLDSTAPPAHWDRKAGFSSAGAAARLRRREDAAACALIGMAPIWLSFADSQYASDRSGVWQQMEPVLQRADLILIPGFPLWHEDHVWVSNVIYEHEQELAPIALYAEQPYAELAWFAHQRVPEREAPLIGLEDGSLSWVRSRPSAGSWLRKNRALLRYGSQLRALARPSIRLPLRTALYELGRGGEYLAFREPSSAATASLQGRDSNARGRPVRV
jgi:LmbE family N-acetylglucosaminyl deacetylase